MKSKKKSTSRQRERDAELQLEDLDAVTGGRENWQTDKKKKDPFTFGLVRPDNDGSSGGGRTNTANTSYDLDI